ncbi:transmembrane protein 154-like isoform X2 [Hemiscyllium ocellatum]|uniref:transmembrane protein 154-like isoform X2 n=1 Tax=Hemiscyllium ocellatum TaxID=170820 RepID=UPI0029664854|nr:transmembrane protein 154-like isoform X2 [Hemiscyllium ocellatum]
MHTICKGNMNQQNWRLYLILSGAFLLSANSYSSQKNETTTSMIHATQPAPSGKDRFVPLSTAITHHGLCTNNSLTLPVSNQASATVPQNTPTRRFLEAFHKGNAASSKTTDEHLWNSTSPSVSPPATKNIAKTPLENNKVILMIVLPILGLALVGLVIAFLINHTHEKKQRAEHASEDQVALNHEINSENPASPIFEDDVASVMEVEMDELDRWMGNMKKISPQDSLPDISEEKDLKSKSRDPEL